MTKVLTGDNEFGPEYAGLTEEQFNAVRDREVSLGNAVKMGADLEGMLGKDNVRIEEDEIPKSSRAAVVERSWQEIKAHKARQRALRSNMMRKLEKTVGIMNQFDVEKTAYKMNVIPTVLRAYLLSEIQILGSRVVCLEPDVFLIKNPFE